jgi:type IV secretory pathway component VirB8
VFISQKFFSLLIKILYTHDVFTNKYQRTGLRFISLKANSEAKGLNRVDVILAIQQNEATFYSYLTTKQVIITYSYIKFAETPYIGNATILFWQCHKLYD